MKKLLLITVFLLTMILIPSEAFAQTDNHTAREEAEGKEIWEKLQSKQLECKKLTDDNYGVLGEYFMGQSIGNTERHAVMNQMMTNMMGEDGEKQMHITLGKRSSGCDANAPLPSGYGMPMMWWMMRGGGNPMMGYGGWGNWLFMLVFWAILVLGVIALIRYLGVSGRRDNEGKTPLDILKERYAKGEINKKEFEEMKKELE